MGRVGKPTKKAHGTATKGNNKAEKDVKPGERFHFKYLRLRVKQYDATIEFFQLLGMNLEWELDSIVPGTNIKGALLQFRANDRDFHVRNTGILIEFDSLLKNKQDSPWNPPEGNNVRWAREYLLVYVHNIHKLYKRMNNRGLKMKVPLETYHDLNYYVVEDPNGLEVRVVEGTDAQMSDTHLAQASDQSWFSRFGYYMMEVDTSEKVVPYYEKLFSEIAPELQVKANTASTGSSSVPEAPAASGTPNTSNPAAPAINATELLLLQEPSNSKLPSTSFLSRVGYRVVDAEDVITGLSHEIYRWLANDGRDRVASIGYVEKSTTGTSIINRPNLVASPHFVSLGFELNPIFTMDYLKKLWGREIQYEEFNMSMGEVGVITKFKDPLGRDVDIFSSHGRSDVAKSTKVKRTVAPVLEKKKKSTQKKHMRAKSCDEYMGEFSGNRVRMEHNRTVRDEWKTLRRTRSLWDLDAKRKEQLALQGDANKKEKKPDSAQNGSEPPSPTAETPSIPLNEDTSKV